MEKKRKNGIFSVEKAGRICVRQEGAAKSGAPDRRPRINKKADRLRNRLFGGGWWIRTTEGIASRFTVCPLWPLGKSPIYNMELELVDGFEPPTC